MIGPAPRHLRFEMTVDFKPLVGVDPWRSVAEAMDGVLHALQAGTRDGQVDCLVHDISAWFRIAPAKKRAKP